MLSNLRKANIHGLSPAKCHIKRNLVKIDLNHNSLRKSKASHERLVRDFAE
jgi:hypothetical protein